MAQGAQDQTGVKEYPSYSAFAEEFYGSIKDPKFPERLAWFETLERLNPDGLTHKELYEKLSELDPNFSAAFRVKGEPEPKPATAKTAQSLLRRGELLGGSSMFNTLANVAGLVSQASEVTQLPAKWIAEKISGKKAPPVSLLREAESALRERSESARKEGEALPAPQGFRESVISGAPQFLYNLPPYLLRATPGGMATVGAIEAADQGPKQMAQQASINYALGRWGFPLAEKYAPPVLRKATLGMLPKQLTQALGRPVGAGAAVTAMDLASGAPLESALAQGAIMSTVAGTMGGIGGRRRPPGGGGPPAGGGPPPPPPPEAGAPPPEVRPVEARPQPSQYWLQAKQVWEYLKANPGKEGKLDTATDRTIANILGLKGTKASIAEQASKIRQAGIRAENVVAGELKLFDVHGKPLAEPIAPPIPGQRPVTLSDFGIEEPPPSGQRPVTMADFEVPPEQRPAPPPIIRGLLPPAPTKLGPAGGLSAVEEGPPRRSYTSDPVDFAKRHGLDEAEVRRWYAESEAGLDQQMGLENALLNQQIQAEGAASEAQIPAIRKSIDATFGRMKALDELIEARRSLRPDVQVEETLKWFEKLTPEEQADQIDQLRWKLEQLGRKPGLEDFFGGEPTGTVDYGALRRRLLREAEPDVERLRRLLTQYEDIYGRRIAPPRAEAVPVVEPAVTPPTTEPTVETVTPPATPRRGRRRRAEREETIGAVPIEQMERPVAGTAGPSLAEGKSYLRGIGVAVNARVERPTRAAGMGEGAPVNEFTGIATIKDARGNPLKQFSVTLDADSNAWRAVELSQRGRPLVGTERTGNTRESLEVLLGRRPAGPPTVTSETPLGAVAATSSGAEPIGGQPPPQQRPSAGRTRSVSERSTLPPAEQRLSDNPWETYSPEQLKTTAAGVRERFGGKPTEWYAYESKQGPVPPWDEIVEGYARYIENGEMAAEPRSIQSHGDWMVRNLRRGSEVASASAGRTAIGGEVPPAVRGGLVPGRTYTVSQSAPDLDLSAGEQLTLLSSKGNAHSFRTPGGSTVAVEATPERLLEVLGGEGEQRVPFGRETGAVPGTSLIDVELRFPLSAPAQRGLLDAANDPLIERMAKQAGIAKIVVDEPYKFELSQEGGVTEGGVVRLNPNVADLRGTLLHELGEVVWERSSEAQRKTLTELAQRNRAALEKDSPGYARMLSEGQANEAVAQMFSMYDSLPKADQAALASVAPERAFAEAFKEQPKTALVPERKAPGVRSWEEINKEGGYLTEADDLARIVQQHGDQQVVIKDVNGGRHRMPASMAARALDDPVISGHVREVFTSGKPTGEVQLDSYTLQYLPNLKAAFSKLLSTPPAIRGERGAVPGEVLGELYEGAKRFLKEEEGGVPPTAPDKLESRTYEIVRNKLPDTPGRYHLRRRDTTDPIDEERIAAYTYKRFGWSFNSLDAAKPHLEEFQAEYDRAFPPAVETTAPTPHTPTPPAVRGAEGFLREEKGTETLYTPVLERLINRGREVLKKRAGFWAMDYPEFEHEVLSRLGYEYQKYMPFLWDKLRPIPTPKEIQSMSLADLRAAKESIEEDLRMEDFAGYLEVGGKKGRYGEYRKPEFTQPFDEVIQIKYGGHLPYLRDFFRDLAGEAAAGNPKAVAVLSKEFGPLLPEIGKLFPVLRPALKVLENIAPGEAAKTEAKPELPGVSRREFLKASGGAIATAKSAPAMLAKTAIERIALALKAQSPGVQVEVEPVENVFLTKADVDEMGWAEFTGRKPKAVYAEAAFTEGDAAEMAHELRGEQADFEVKPGVVVNVRVPRVYYNAGLGTGPKVQDPKLDYAKTDNEQIIFTGTPEEVLRGLSRSDAATDAEGMSVAERLQDISERSVDMAIRAMDGIREQTRARNRFEAARAIRRRIEELEHAEATGQAPKPVRPADEVAPSRPAPLALPPATEPPPAPRKPPEVQREETVGERIRRFPRSEEGEINYKKLAEAARSAVQRAKGKIIDTAWVSPEGKFKTFRWTTDNTHSDEALKILGVETKGLGEDQFRFSGDKALDDLMGERWIRFHKNNVQATVEGAQSKGFREAVQAAADWVMDRYGPGEYIYIDVGPHSTKLKLEQVEEMLDNPMEFMWHNISKSERPPGGLAPPPIRQTAVA